MKLLSKIGRFSKRLAVTALVITLTATPTQAATLLGTFNFYETANIFSIITNRASSSKGTEYIVINGTENQAKEIRDEYVRQFAACADYELIVEKHMPNQQILKFRPFRLKRNIEKTKELSPEIKEKTEEITKACKTDEERANAISKYIIRNYAYEAIVGTKSEDASLENFWDYKIGNCWQYSKLFRTMCEYAGMESRIVYGYVNGRDDLENRHAWNEVKVDNEWKYIDVTWRDISFFKNSYGLTNDLWSNHEIKEEYQMG